MFLLNRKKLDLYFDIFLSTNGLLSAVSVILILIFLFKESFLALDSFGLSFLNDKSWFPLEGQFNMVPMMAATLSTAFGALLLAIPLSFFTAIFYSFYCPFLLKFVFKRVIELYSAIPSVIFGFWGLMKIVPLINQINPPGQSLLAGIFILSLMIFPLLSLNLISSFEMASFKNYKVSQSLGLRKSSFIWFILIPSVKRQILSGLFISLGRALGETMAVLMVCGNIVKIPTSLFDPVRTLTANMALEMSYALGTHRSALFLSGLILLLLVIALTLCSKITIGPFAWKK